MKQPPTHPSAKQSQAWLSKALLALMEQKPYRSITISEIAEKAGLSRRTYYRVFDAKEDLLFYYAETLYREFLVMLNRNIPDSYRDVIRLYLEFWYKHKHFLLLMKQNDLTLIIVQGYRRYFPEVFKVVKADHPLANNPEALSYAMAYSAGGLFSLLLHWLRNDMAHTPDEMMALIDVAFLHLP